MSSQYYFSDQFSLSIFLAFLIYYLYRKKKPISKIYIDEDLRERRMLMLE